MIGVKSTALAWGEKTKEVASYLSLAMFGLMASAGYSSGIGLLYYPALSASFLFMRDMLKKVDIDDRESCNNFFVKNRLFGAFILASIILGKLPINP